MLLLSPKLCSLNQGVSLVSRTKVDFDFATANALNEIFCSVPIDFSLAIQLACIFNHVKDKSLFIFGKSHYQFCRFSQHNRIAAHFLGKLITMFQKTFSFIPVIGDTLDITFSELPSYKFYHKETLSLLILFRLCDKYIIAFFRYYVK